IYMGAVTLWAALVVPRLFGTTLARLYVVVLAVTVVGVLVTWWAVPLPGSGAFGDWLDSPVGRFLLFLVSLVGWGWVAALRGKVCAAAFRETLFSPSGRPTLLNEIHAAGIDHVFCSTDLQSAEQVYFGRDFIYGYRFGKG